MKQLILFDIDGTLTKPRQAIEEDMKLILDKFRALDHVDIGVVGGSDLKKQKEQLGENSVTEFNWFFSENGLVSFKDGQEFAPPQNIINHIGENNLQQIINFSLEYISKLDIPKKRSHFIELRNGMLNISPIGRNCTLAERLEFYEFDKTHNIRKIMVQALKKQFVDKNLTFAIGGQISIDIFPKGWDKTFCLQYLDMYDEIYFFGDKTDAGGNDHEIYMDDRTIGYSVKSPQDTLLCLRQLYISLVV